MMKNILQFTHIRTALLTVLASAWFLLGAASPDDALKSFLSASAVDSGRTAVYIFDLDAGHTIASHRPGCPVVPASVMKCVSTAALATVAPYTRTVDTEVFYDGEIKDGVLQGNVTVVGAGDPSLGDGRHPGHPDFTEMFVDALRKKGIKELRGAIKIDNSLFAGSPVPSDWLSEDLGQSYGTGCHAFNFEGNASGKKSVADPGAVFKKKLAARLSESGIAYTEAEGGSQRGKRRLLFSYSSPPLADLMRSCMFRSDNLYAETFLRLFGLNNGSDGSVAHSAKIAMQHWDALNFDVEGIEIADGSGLSRSNHLTAEFLGEVLRSRASDPWYVSFFPLVGEEGTVKSFMAATPLKGRLALKTGSMNGIQSYAGYLLDGDYMPTHVVVVMTDGLKNRSAYREALSKFFLSIF